MIKNYFKIAFRNTVRHRAFPVINIAGLAIGISSCLLNMNALIFIIAILISIFIAWIAVGYKSVKTAVANPVKSLRSE